MKKIIRLTESDLNKMIKRIIRESNEQGTMEEVINNPKVEMAAEEAISNMSPKDLRSLKMAFNNLGVSPNSSFGDIKDAVDNFSFDMDGSNELSEDEEISGKKKLWNNVRRGLFVLGIGNAALFFTPFTILYNELMGLGVNSDFMEPSAIISGLLLLMGANVVHDDVYKTKK